MKVLLAGAAGRIGTPLTQHLIDQGHEILACDIHSENEWSIDCSYAQLNLLNTDKLCKIIEENGPFKAAINCSYPKNSAFGTAFEELSLNDFQENLNLHLGAYFNLAQQIVPHFQKNNGGHLIQFSSIYGFVPPRFWIYEESGMDLPIEYSMIKAAIIQMTKYLARRYPDQNLRFNCVSPGGILDNQNPQFLEKYKSYCSSKGMLNPEDLFGAVDFLLSNTSRYFQGQNLTVDDGFSL